MNSVDFEAFWVIYTEAFPTDERRSREQQESLTDPRYCVELFEQNGIPVGFCCSWELDDFLFLEHIAVASVARGSGIGSRVFKQKMESSKTPIVLEVEPPETDVARRRIELYMRLGFVLNAYGYVQPPLRPDSKPVSLQIMSWPDALTDETFESAKTILYREVYQVSTDWTPQCSIHPKERYNK